MSVMKGFLTTIVSGILFAAAGTGLGYSIGKYAPDYYRLVFRVPSDIEFDPIHLGVGLGATQGLAAGLLVGLVIVISVSWYNSRVTSHSDSVQSA